MAESNEVVLKAIDSLARPNVYMMKCDVIGTEKQLYASCARNIVAMNNGNEHQLSPKCQDAVACGNCPALKMRKEEEAQDRALYAVIPGINDPLDGIRARLLGKIGMKPSNVKSYMNGFQRRDGKAMSVNAKKANLAEQSRNPEQTAVGLDDALAASAT